MRAFAFSLIELMVVIAIIGLLVGVAVPTYQNYVIRSRVATAFTVMESYAQLGEQYYENNGQFGDAQAIGLTTSGASNNVANPSTINKYTSAQIVDVDGTSKCYNNIRFTFSGTALGIAQNFDIQMVVRPNNGLYVVTCGIPWDQTSSSYAAVLGYFPESCQQQNVSTC